MQKAGWKTEEKSLLKEELSLAESEGRSVRSVFERVASKTGRKPNSIRNYYYLKLREGEISGTSPHAFRAFTESEADELLDAMIAGISLGKSVRGIASELAKGDRKEMLRLQNKYRSLLRTRPDLIEASVERLNAQGVKCDVPTLGSRRRRELDPPSLIADITSALDTLAGMLQGTGTGGDMIEMTRELTRERRLRESAERELAMLKRRLAELM